eukprot:249280_1
MATVTSKDYQRLILCISGYVRQLHKKAVNTVDIILVVINFHGVYFMDSKILTDNALKTKLFQLISSQVCFKKTILLFSGARDGFTREKLYNNCGNKRPSIVLVKTNWKNICGGYTTVAWKYRVNEPGCYYSDKDAFLFVLESENDEIKPQIFNIKSEMISKAINYCGETDETFFADEPLQLFHFGSATGLSLKEHCNVRNDNICYGGDVCGYEIPKGNMMCGGNTIHQEVDSEDGEIFVYKHCYQFTVEDFEVFQILE